jgi:hypothetical protein
LRKFTSVAHGIRCRAAFGYGAKIKYRIFHGNPSLLPTP